MNVYRIDNREYNVGDTIELQNVYQNELTGDKLLVEQLLEEHRPENKPNRNSILMVFENFDNAKSHWTIQTNSKFYKAEINNTEILHRGDFNKTEELYKHINDEDIRDNIAIEYWNETMSEIPKVEIFVNSINITEVLSNSEDERKNAFGIRAGFEPRINIRVITNDI